MNRQIVREHYRKLLGLDKAEEEEEYVAIHIENDVGENQKAEQILASNLLEIPPHSKRSKTLPSVKKIEEEFMEDHSPTDYYYKRWLWIQFPWTCLSVRCDYSAKMKSCFSSAIKYMSVNEEKLLTKRNIYYFNNIQRPYRLPSRLD